MKKLLIVMVVLSYFLFVGCDKTVDKTQTTQTEQNHSDHDHDGNDHSGHDHSAQDDDTNSNHKSSEEDDHSGHDHSDGNDHSGHDHGSTGDEHDHGHEEENTTLGSTTWTDNFEVYMEYQPMVVGKEAHILVHLTKLDNFAPVDHIHIFCKCSEDGKQISLPEPSMISPGIFELNFTPEKTGTVEFNLELDMHEIVENVQVEASVFSSEADGAAALATYNETNSDKVNFKKEQAWKTEFETALSFDGEINSVIKTSGELIPAPGDEVTYTAIAAGKVKFNNNYALEGITVAPRKLILTITPSGIKDNITSMYQQAKAEFEKDKANYERAQRLLDKKYISEKEFDVIKAEYVTAKSNFETISKDYNPEGQQVRSQSAGYIKELFVNEGEYVEAGAKLFTVSKNKKVLLRADVSQKYFSDLGTIESASFRAPHSRFYYDTDFLKGKKIAFGKTHSTSSHFVPVYFEIENEVEILPGSFIEIILRSQSKHSAVIIPRSALIEEFGSYAVFVQTSGEYFEKREVQLGVFDGFSYEVIKGLKAGERVITKGAYQVKMSSMSGSAPAHTH